MFEVNLAFLILVVVCYLTVASVLVKHERQVA